MRYELSLKEFVASKNFHKLLARYLCKIKRKLRNFSEDITRVTIIIKKHKKNHFFSGSFSLLLPVKPINAVTGGNTAEEVLANGFEKLLREYELYKGKHFKGSSKYPDKNTLRASDRLEN